MTEGNKISTAFATGFPSPQAMIDIFKGAWKAALPPEFKVTAGPHTHFMSDDRVLWAEKLLPGGFAGKSILELGPFEAYATRLMERFGAEKVIAIEANNINFLKCLVLKEATGLRARFLHGDFLEYLKRAPESFDIIWASGVLYHSVDPGALLEQSARVADNLFIWTHYVSDEMMKTAQAGMFEPANNRQVEVGGVTIEYHFRSYRLKYDNLPLHYEGGTTEYSCWVTKADLLAALRACGFGRVEIHKDGAIGDMPFISLLAMK